MKKWKTLALILALYVAVWLTFCVILITYTLKSLSFLFLAVSVAAALMIRRKVRR